MAFLQVQRNQRLFYQCNTENLIGADDSDDSDAGPLEDIIHKFTG